MTSPQTMGVIRGGTMGTGIALVCALAAMMDVDEERVASGCSKERSSPLLRGILILAVCVGLSSLFRGEMITFLTPLIKDALGEGFNVIGWVMLWRPVEAYFFDPLPLHTSNAVHRFLSSLSVEIRV